LQGYARAVTRLRGMAHKWVALGGGGYNLNNVPRAWTLVWAIMNGREPDPAIPQDFLQTARSFGFTESSLWDPSVPEAKFPKRAAKDYAVKQVGIIKESAFPIHGIKGA
jgi:acetoin utilization protein AcuC